MWVCVCVSELLLAVGCCVILRYEFGPYVNTLYPYGVPYGEESAFLELWVCLFIYTITSSKEGGSGGFDNYISF